MYPMFFTSHRKKGKTILILDVQSSIARASVVSYLEGDLKPRVTFTAERTVPYRPQAGTSYLIKSTLDALKECVDAGANFVRKSNAGGDHPSKTETYGSGAIPKVSEIHFVLSSPWVVSKAKTIKQTFPRPTTVTRKGVVTMIEKERAGDAPEQTDLVEIVEEKIFSVKLNGYHIADWEGKVVKELEVSFAVSVAGSGMIERFRESCTRIVRPDEIFFHSALLLQHIGVKMFLPDKDDYMLIHAHGELTDVVATEGGECVFFGSFPIGINTIVRAIGKATKISTDTADSLVTLFAGGYMDKVEEANAVDAIDTAAKNWNEEFAKLLRESGHDFRQFHAVVVTARAHEEFFTQSFCRAHPEAKIEPFTAEQMTDRVSFGPHTEVLRLTGLYAIAINSLSN